MKHLTIQLIVITLASIAAQPTNPVGEVLAH